MYTYAFEFTDLGYKQWVIRINGVYAATSASEELAKEWIDWQHRKGLNDE